MKRYLKRGICCLLIVAPIVAFLSCLVKNEGIKKEADYKVCEEWELPDVLRLMIEERKEKAFRFCYEDSSCLYIAAGYGRQETGEYVVAVEELYEMGDSLVVDLILTGNRHIGERNTADPSKDPYIVLRTEKKGKRVLFR